MKYEMDYENRLIAEGKKPSPAVLQQYAVEESKRQGIDPNLVLAIMQTESSGGMRWSNPTTTAFGPMQLLKKTAEDLGVDRFDPYDNIRGGIKYIKKLSRLFPNQKDTIMAYHEGQGKLSQIKRGIKELSKEGRGHLEKTLRHYSVFTKTPYVNEMMKVAQEECGSIAIRDKKIIITITKADMKHLKNVSRG